MSEKPIISVIVPVYNTEKYLRDCLASVQRQTLSNFEVLIINDKTPDNSMAIAREFFDIDSRFIIIEHKVNKGLGGARNTGIEHAKGKYIFFLDSDDLLPVDSLELLWNASGHGKSDMVIGNMAWYSEHYLSLVNYIDTRIRSWQTLPIDNLRRLPESDFYTGNVGNRLFKQNLIIDNIIKFPEKLYFEDMPFSVETWFFSKNIKSINNIVNFHTKRQDPSNPSITQTYNKKSYFDRDRIAKLIFDFCINNLGSELLGSVTLLRLVGTSKEMLNSVPGEIKNDIIIGWFPKHLIQINQMVDILNKKVKS